MVVPFLRICCLELHLPYFPQTFLTCMAPLMYSQLTFSILESNRLTGTIPFYNYTKLHTLNLSFNSFGHIEPHFNSTIVSLYAFFLYVGSTAHVNVRYLQQNELRNVDAALSGMTKVNHLYEEFYQFPYKKGN